MRKFLKTSTLMHFLAGVFNGDKRTFSDRGCRAYHISPETRAKV